ncbi:MAG: transposase, partial [Myxococcales bacterium]
MLVAAERRRSPAARRSPDDDDIAVRPVRSPSRPCARRLCGRATSRPPNAGRKQERTAYEEGFSLHAGVHLHANDREGLAHLCGYGARPPLVQTRLSQLADGRLAYLLKRPLADGTAFLVLEPCELLRRLAALVPPPRAHLVRYHGVVAPASAWRSRIVPELLRVFREDVPRMPVRRPSRRRGLHHREEGRDADLGASRLTTTGTDRGGAQCRAGPG